MVSVVVNDYVVNRRVKLFFLPEDFEIIQNRWEESDPLLEGLQAISFFTGRTRWCDLTPAHYRLLVAKNLMTAGHLHEKDRLDDDNPVVSSLNFLICALVYCIETMSECHVETLKLNRIDEMDLAVEFLAAMQMEFPKSSPKLTKRPDPFSVVVDNTKDDQ